MTEQEQSKRLKSLLRHIDAVRVNCIKLGDIFIADNQEPMGLALIANGYTHDHSKFTGIEWLYLNDETFANNQELFKAAHHQHVTTNLHHPEAWLNGVHDMDQLHLAEMVCDWASRSSEKGTDLREFLKNTATKKYDMPIQCKAYREIKRLMDLLLDAPFK